jgi:hypothetical protein
MKWDTAVKAINTAVPDAVAMNDIDVGGFFAGFSPKNHNGSIFVDRMIVARDGKFLR